MIFCHRNRLRTERDNDCAKKPHCRYLFFCARIHRRTSRMYLMIDNYDSFVYNLKAYLQELGRDILVHGKDGEGRLDLGTEGGGAHVGVVPVVHPLLEGQNVVHGLLAVVGILE